MLKSYLPVYLKGLLMGVCDIIPGISGGTIAFITGIYERLLNAVRNFSPELVVVFSKWLMRRSDSVELKKAVGRLDLVFLVVLFGGIATALLLMSGLIKYLLDNYFAYVISFFVGLILASSKIIYDNIENHKLSNILWGVPGFVLGLSLAFIMPAKTEPSAMYIVLSGFLGISAMFLPGISGAFILLIMGVYEYMLGVLHNVLARITDLLLFGLGAVLGVFTISRVITFLFSRNKSGTLYVLLGLVIGALSLPVKNVVINSEGLTLLSFMLMGFLLLAGAFLVWIVQTTERRLRVRDKEN